MKSFRIYTYSGSGTLNKFQGKDFNTQQECIDFLKQYIKNKWYVKGNQYLIIHYTEKYNSKIIQILNDDEALFNN